MTFLKRTLHNHPQIKRALKSVAKSAGLFRNSPANDFYRDLAEVKTRGDDAFSKLFYGYDGDHLINKWNHFLPIYSRLFAPFRDGRPDGRPLRFLEIGVYEGGSSTSGVASSTERHPLRHRCRSALRGVRRSRRAGPYRLAGRSRLPSVRGRGDGRRRRHPRRRQPRREPSTRHLRDAVSAPGAGRSLRRRRPAHRVLAGLRGRLSPPGHVPGDDEGVHRRHARLVSRPGRAGDRPEHRRDPRLRQHRRLREGGGERPFHTTIGTPQRAIDRVR